MMSPKKSSPKNIVVINRIQNKIKNKKKNMVSSTNLHPKNPKIPDRVGLPYKFYKGFAGETANRTSKLPAEIYAKPISP